MTQPHRDPQVVSLQTLVAQGGETGRLGFHLMSLDYHASAIREMGAAPALELLLDLLGQHAMAVYSQMETEGPETLEVVKSGLIVPGR